MKSFPTPCSGSSLFLFHSPIQTGAPRSRRQSRGPRLWIWGFEADLAQINEPDTSLSFWSLTQFLSNAWVTPWAVYTLLLTDWKDWRGIEFIPACLNTLGHRWLLAFSSPFPIPPPSHRAQNCSERALFQHCLHISALWEGYKEFLDLKFATLVFPQFFKRDRRCAWSYFTAFYLKLGGNPLSTSPDFT